MRIVSAEKRAIRERLGHHVNAPMTEPMTIKQREEDDEVEAQIDWRKVSGW